ncbi:hypothetical protein EIN_270230 [Entamoeba invadens IP1]|uniref:Leucine rich repeat containing protein BspA family protein n=1 Tax=Entamoeba invadens IP1 TaxID=370355 RepID=A0A0A1UBS3_ENTIV|nr:hypothetical protein EIN_270230 [Entamoeba invadens IP1]ELP91137.1 hypothetical protein EIN_270230 [Entamoeba invadens IP1]|eukprot:XP_004257908.1 hypothetical protein EIN_270230 [Entamoeba invadens IP1]
MENQKHQIFQTSEEDDCFNDKEIMERLKENYSEDDDDDEGEGDFDENETCEDQDEKEKIEQKENEDNTNETDSVILNQCNDDFLQNEEKEIKESVIQVAQDKQHAKSYIEKIHKKNSFSDGTLVDGGVQGSLLEPTNDNQIVISCSDENDLEKKINKYTLFINQEEITTEHTKDIFYRTTVVLAENVKILGKNTFKDWSCLSTFMQRDAYLMWGFYSNPEKVEEIYIGNGITFVGESCFQGCIALTKLVIPASVKQIEMNAWEGCSNLTQVDFQSSNTIATKCFGECEKVKAVRFKIDNSANAMDIFKRINGADLFKKKNN